ncbi:hypothetical protein BB560_000626 [Smittium megazygosporum]|uniref:Uncharacterized protein n=1 Tax=Smittium megazygosporum TaxID=133381 RepID=A0A2T9ZJU4_9FUNG|nr:hypothetical protein BB560_000626 [Smittium megazygosporum]
MNKVSAPRFAHTEGYLVTGGTDSLIRIFHTKTETRDLEAKTLEYPSDSIVSICTSNDKVVCSDEEGNVLGFTLNKKTQTEIEANPLGTLHRSSLPVWDTKISANGMQALIPTEEGKVHIISLLDMSELLESESHGGPIISIDSDSTGSKIVTLQSNGTLKLWSTDSLTFECLKTWEKFARSCQPGEPEDQNKVRFQTNGSLIAIPSKEGGVSFIDSNSYEEVKKLKDTIHDLKFVAWSPTGEYAAIVDRNEISLWEMKKYRSVGRYIHTETICTMSWHPTENMISFSDNLGAIFFWDEPIQPILDSNEKQNQESFAQDETIETINEAESLFNEFSTSPKKNKNETFIQDEAIAEKYDLFDEQEPNNGYESEDYMDDFIVDDDHDDYKKFKNKSSKNQNTVASFQPSATPWLGNKCYLAFNTIGTVISTKVDDTHNSIEIEFFDKSSNRDIRFPDPYKFSMASLSSMGCLFGINSSLIESSAKVTKEKSDKQLSDSGSFILYRAFKGWADQSDWSFKMNSGEFIRCLTISNRGAAIFSSLGYLRLISIGGVQTWIESIPNSVISCVAKDKVLFYICQQNIGSEGVQRGVVSSESFYTWELRDISNGKRTGTGNCPVSANSKITWIGFTEEGLPLVLDSEGILRCLSLCKVNDYLWLPVFDAKSVSKQRDKQESYWPVGALTNNFIVAIIKPILSELPFSLPVLHEGSELSNEDKKYMLESVTLRGASEFLAMQSKPEPNMDNGDEIELDKLLLSSINVACKLGKLTRAIDLVMMLNSKESLLAAEKIAVFHKNESLAQKIIEYRSSIDGEDSEDHNIEQDCEDGLDYDLENNSTYILQRGLSKDKKKSSLNKGNRKSYGETLEKNYSVQYSNSDKLLYSYDGEEEDLTEDEEDASKDKSKLPVRNNMYPDSLLESQDNPRSEISSALSSELTPGSLANSNISAINSARKRTAHSAFNPFAVVKNKSMGSPIGSKDSEKGTATLESQNKKVRGLAKFKNPFDIHDTRDSDDSWGEENGVATKAKEKKASVFKSAKTTTSKKQTTLGILKLKLSENADIENETVGKE